MSGTGGVAVAHADRLITSEDRLRKVLLRLLAPERVAEILVELRDVKTVERPTEHDRATAEKYLRRAGRR